ncbi:hypothetical protein, partial [Streptomyces sp. NPDC031705]|uniref:hypothetical protein n=1 Tax=Streptomyces sp. NPDC031705 TaxID=3155729 RepID=UPI0033E92B00
ALIFGTLLSSQGTDASFVLTLSGFPPGFRSVLFLRFRFYQTLSCPISSALSRSCAFALSLSGGSDSISGFPSLRPLAVSPRGHAERDQAEFEIITG